MCSIQPLVQCYQRLRESGKVFNIQLTESWMRHYQVSKSLATKQDVHYKLCNENKNCITYDNVAALALVDSNPCYFSMSLCQSFFKLTST